ncbi:hypothetical protein EUTSA_v10013847mg [Eutrema salsugineum]|uniref:DUF4408 domain-containing protein n=1 Tax=Eutrema salsugineum TaxID=72664 RepID=V4LS71_EUTSA|nr:uncharacterized protein LOC18019199 [Eutrema salsugineum]ESQ42713.1 hypothetical protein EUTSA_v10013847mg [Eutrema salsugineum]
MELISTVASWFTPTTLFLLLNLMVGTIVLTSRLGSGSRNHHPHHNGFGSGHAPAPLTRASSIIDRVKSINFHLYKFPHPETELFSMTNHHDVIGSDLHVYPDPNPAPLQRAPSLLDRVKSINMSYFKFPNDITGSDLHSHPDDPNPNPAPLQRAPSLLDRVKSINMSYFKFHQYNPEESDYANHTEPTRFENIPTRKVRVEPIDISKFRIPEEDQPSGPRFDNPIDPPSLTRAPSILERVKSIKLSSFYRSDPDIHSDQNPDPNSVIQEDHKHVRSKSESKKPMKKKKKATGKMTKSASEKSGFGFNGSQEATETVKSIERRRPDTTRVERSTSIGDGEDCVDAKASDFINKFKQQLKLQRLDSILRYKEMLKAN